MSFRTEDTVVDYPSGATESAGTVLHVEETERGTAVVLDRTAFHPVDGHWPDQPADRGRLVLADGTAVDILDALVGATDGDRLFIGDDVPVRTGTEGWGFLVVHVVPAGVAIREGDRVEVVADAGYRAALSRGHTACHLASLALDRALAGAWSKEVPSDSLGAPAFDQLAIERSEILEDGARDTYRIGKSLRKKGFDVAALDDLDAVAARANAALAGWVASGAAIRIDRADDAISARRTWVCELPGQEARIPCGGTHLTSLEGVGSITVALELADVEGGRELRMRTSIAFAD